MNKAIVLGATGGMGQALVQELAARRVQTVAFARTRDRLEAYFGGVEGVEIVAGDALRLDDVISASRGADVIFHSMNVPYPVWQDTLPRIMENVIEAARRNGAKIAMVDNVYAYGKAQSHRVDESYPKQPHTKKGRIRLELEQMLWQAHRNGTQALVAHFPDFYGPRAENTMMGYTLQGIVKKGRSGFVGSLDVPREYIFLPDGAKALVELASRKQCYGQNWNIPGAGVITGREIVRIAEEAMGQRVQVSQVTKTMIALLGLFNPLMREMKEMMYLTEEPLVLSGEKYSREIGPLPATPYREGIAQTIRSLQA